MRKSSSLPFLSSTEENDCNLDNHTIMHIHGSQVIVGMTSTYSGSKLLGICVGEVDIGETGLDGEMQGGGFWRKSLR